MRQRDVQPLQHHHEPSRDHRAVPRRQPHEAPRYLIRDRDRIYGSVVTRRLRAMGIRDRPTASASPWQNGFAERLIGSIRRESVDHIIVLGEVHLRRILRSYARYYNDIRAHRSLDKDAPVSRPVQRTGKFTRDTWWTSPSLLPGLGFRYTHQAMVKRFSMADMSAAVIHANELLQY